MKTFNYIFLVLLFFGTNQAISAQENQTVTLTTIGEGATRDEAKNNALRNAIEQAFGTFISSNTQVVNDDLIKDEIVSVSSGNIEKFEIKSETQLPNSTFALVVESTVSVAKLKSFCENKGIIVEFKGNLFAANLKLKELNKNNEAKVIANLFNIIKPIVKKGFDFTIEANDPVKAKGNSIGGTFYDPVKNDYIDLDSYYSVFVKVNAKQNKNFELIYPILINTLENLKLTENEILDNETKKIECFTVFLDDKKIVLRSSSSIAYLNLIFDRLIPLSAIEFKIVNELFSKSYKQILTDKTKVRYRFNGNIDGLYKDKNIIVFDDIPYLIKSYFANYNIVFRSNEDDLFRYLNSYGDYPDQKITDNFKYSTFPLKINLYNNVDFTFEFVTTLKIDDLSKISEFKVTPEFESPTLNKTTKKEEIKNGIRYQYYDNGNKKSVTHTVAKNEGTKEFNILEYDEKGGLIKETLTDGDTTYITFFGELEKVIKREVWKDGIIIN